MPFDIAPCSGARGGEPLPHRIQLVCLFMYLFEMNPCCLKSFYLLRDNRYLWMDSFVAVVMCPLLLLALLYFNKPLPVISPVEMCASSSELMNSIHHSFHLITIVGLVSECRV